ncbi:MAG: DUF4974 domain-containing protein [Bacteroides sp.]|nr:DUF4974 domain-containing protein [Bacteroides sp.]
MDKRIIRYLLDELTPDERLEFLREVQSDRSLKAEFIACQNLHSLMSLSGDEKTEESRAGYVRFLELRQKRRFRILAFRSLKYASVLLLLVLCTHWVSTRYFLSGDSYSDTHTLYVPAGQRTCLTLHDGSVIWLNARSTLIYPTHFRGKERRVSLIGEGYFEIAPDASRPFVVSAAQVDMTVLGTKFNVYSYPELGYVQTSLLEGSLLVTSLESSSQVLLTPGDQVTVRSEELNLGKIKEGETFLWRDGIYSFEDERLGDIVRKLELYYDVRIFIKTAALAEIRYTCKFRQRDGIDEILRLISRIYPFDISKDRENNIITLY